MKFLSNLIIAIPFCFLFSCKKSSGPNEPHFSDSSHILQSVIYKVNVTTPSPWDLAHNPQSDSVVVNYNRLVGPPDYCRNFPGVGFSILSTGSGFGFSYLLDPFNSSSATFIISFLAIPSVNSDFVLNKPYENTLQSPYLNTSIFLTMKNGTAGIPLYFTDSIPSDAIQDHNPDVTTYCKIIFTNKYSVYLINSKLTLIDGVVSGYQLCRYGLTDPNKYVQQWDYTINFKGVVLDH